MPALFRGLQVRPTRASIGPEAKAAAISGFRCAISWMVTLFAALKLLQHWTGPVLHSLLAWGAAITTVARAVRVNSLAYIFRRYG